MARILTDPGRDAPVWFARLWNEVRDTITTILWADIDKAGSTLADIETRAHASLQSIGEADSADTDTTKDKHVSNAQMKAAADHIAATNAHGATGDLIGSGDLATTGAAGVIAQGAAVADIASADAATQTAGYVQADVQSIATLANETKAQLNALLASLRAGAIDT